MSTKLAMIRDINNYVTFGLPFAVDQWGGYLSANVEQHFIVPNNFSIWSINFSIQPGSSIWISQNITAILPTATFGQINCELNPATRLVYAGDLISMITSDETNDWIGATLYALQ